MAIKVRKIENGVVTQEGTKITDEVLGSIVYKEENGIKFENGRIGFQNTGISAHEWKGIYGVTANNDNWVIRGSQLSDNVGYLEIATGDDGTEPIYVTQYGVFSALNCQDTTMVNPNRRTAALLDSDGHTRFPGIIYCENGKRVAKLEEVMKKADKAIEFQRLEGTTLPQSQAGITKIVTTAIGDTYVLTAENKIKLGQAVTSVNGRTGAVSITASEIGAQTTLVSGSNIKTINGQSILGNGNIEIKGKNDDWVTAHCTTNLPNFGVNTIVPLQYFLSENVGFEYRGDSMRAIVSLECSFEIIDYNSVVLDYTINNYNEVLIIEQDHVNFIWKILIYNKSTYTKVKQLSISAYSYIKFKTNANIKHNICQWKVGRYE